MNKKQIILLICVLAIAIIIGVVRGLIFIRTGALPQRFDLVALVAVVILSIIAIGLGRAFRNKKR